MRKSCTSGQVQYHFLALVLLLVSCVPVKTSVPKEEPKITKTATSVRTQTSSDFSSRAGELISVLPTLVDDYLTNPGIGWQQEPGESEIPYLPETVSYSERQKIGWRVLNPQDGVYDWSALDEQITRAVLAGKQFSFRVYSMRGEVYGGHYVPEWVLQKGAVLLRSGEPDYSSCTYQEEWGKFVSELAWRYDGNATIAFIDISGYGNFNEWSWQDNQTIWDELWEQNYSAGTATPSTMITVDSQARRRLADMFIGGGFETHSCRDVLGAVKTVSYMYRGFQKTQLVMPYAGIVQSTQYVFLRRPDVGFRYDCLGTSTNGIVDRLETELSIVWKKAPVVFEFCTPERFDLPLAEESAQVFHSSLIHNNGYSKEKDAIRSLLLNVGYRYYLKEVKLQVESGNRLFLAMNWQNVGLAPSYPKMGQTFQIHFYLINSETHRTIDYPITADVSSWMPAPSTVMPVPENRIISILDLPVDLIPGIYEARISIIDERTGLAINLAFSQPDEFGRYFLTTFPIFSSRTNIK